METKPDTTTVTVRRVAPKPRQWLSKAEVADLFGVNAKTVARRIADGTLPAYRVGQQVRIRLEDVDRMAVRIVVGDAT